MSYLENFVKTVDDEVNEIRLGRDLAGKNTQDELKNKVVTLSEWNAKITEELKYLDKYYSVDSYQVPGSDEIVFEVSLAKTGQLAATLHAGVHYIYGVAIHAVAVDYKVFDNEELYSKIVKEALNFVADRLRKVVIFEETGEIL
jgi:hypothetical protein